MNTARFHRFGAFPALLTLALWGSHASAQNTPVYKDSKAPLENRVTDLFNQLTQDEKISLLSGTAFTTQPIPRLGVPAVGMVDAGQGVRGGMDSTLGPATLFPSGVAMASTWDTELLSRIGQAIGQEALNKGTGAQVLLGPAVNIHRSPLGGRNGEYFSEDPYLAARLGVGYIKGMQSTGCAACIKHYAANNEEVDRGEVNVHVSERALREIYLPAFEAGVKEGGVWTIMSSYNRINGYHATANEYLLTEVLKKGWGFDGMVMSDWGAVHETARVVNAGNDLEMPGVGLLAPAKVKAALGRGGITQQAIDENARRIVRLIVRTGVLDGPRQPNHALVNSPEHQELTYEAASKGIVLLKNEGNVLPLDATQLKSIAVIGGAAQNMQYGAAGSPGLTPFYSINPLDGIKTRAGAGITVNYVAGDNVGVPVPSAVVSPDDFNQGWKGEYFANAKLEGQPTTTRIDPQIQFSWPNPPATGIGQDNFSVRWTGKLKAPTSGTYRFTMTADDGCRVFVNGKAIIDHWQDSAVTTQTGSVDLVQGQSYDIRVEYYQGGGAKEARFNWFPPGAKMYQDVTDAASKADVAVVVVSTSGTEGEGQDRPSMALPSEQDALIKAVAAANKKTIVVLNNGTPVLMNQWLQQVPGLIETWFPGQEGGHALASILFGDVNPSGKLPDTLAVRREDYPDFGNFPGVNNQVNYAEDIYVGYRHFDKRNIAPYFPFGHGLSYTTFQYGPVKFSQNALTPDSKVTATLNLTNTGKRAGAEVVELYVHDLQPKIDKPVRELKGFSRVELAPGETKTVSLVLTPRDLAYCDVPGKQWKADAGNYEIEIGSSSRDIRQRAQLRLASTFTETIPFLGVTAPMIQPKYAAGDLAAGRPAKASSVQQGLNAELTVDGDDETRWGSDFSDPQWVSIDLGKPTTINAAHLSWEDAYAQAYSLQKSDDGQTWTDIYSTTNGKGGEEDIKFDPVTTRWVRLLGTKRATHWGYSLYSFQVFGPKP